MGQVRALTSSRRGGAESSALPPAAVVRVVWLGADRLGREALGAALAGMHPPRFEVVGAFGEVAPVAEAVQRLRPNLLVVEEADGRDGPGLVRQAVRASAPCGARVLVCSGTETDDLIVGCLRAGVHGYVSRSSGLEVLRVAMATVAAGEPFYDTQALRLVAVAATRGINGASSPATGPPPREPALSTREREVWRLVALGYGTKQAAAKLTLAHKTVAGYRTRLMAKLGSHNLAVLTLLAVRAGVVSPWRDPLFPGISHGNGSRPARQRSGRLPQRPPASQARTAPRP